MLQQFINLIFPITCCACNEVLLKSEIILCTECMIQLPKAEIGFSNSQSLANRFAGKVKINEVYSYYKFVKGGKVQNLLHSLKYRNRQDVGLYLGEIFGQKLKEYEAVNKLDLIMAVPLHKSKLLVRGFNQSELIAEGISKSIDVPHETSLISRQKATETQTSKTRIERFFNVNEVFVVSDPEAINGKSIGLVDDVLTTGATLEVCAASLLNAGAKDITIIVLAAAV
jgi:ComF family protein